MRMSFTASFSNWARALATTALIAGFALPAAAASGEVSVALQGDMPSIDPSKDSSPIGYNFRLNVFDSLTDIQADGSVGARLAEKWEPSPDAKVWTFTLRKGVKFHNGDTVTADDVVWTYRKILNDTTSPVRTWIRIVEKVEKIADDRIQFTLAQPFAIFDRQTTFVWIMPQKAYETMGEQAFGQKPIGSGPYMVREWRKDDRLVLDAFKDYWKGEPALKTGIFRPIPAEASRAAALLTGEIGIVPVVPPSMMDRLKSSADVTVGTAEGFRANFLGFNTKLPALSNLKLRQAMDVAIDRDALTKQLLRGLGTPASQVVPPVNFGFDKSRKPTAYDPERAKALVKESGYAGEAIPFQYPSNNLAMANEVAQAVAGYLTAVGINVKLEPMEYTAFFPAWAQRKMTGMYLFAFGSSVYDADSPMTGLYEEGSRIYDVIPEIDKLAKEQRQQTDPDKRRELFAKIFEISQQNLPFIPLYYEMQAFGIRKGIEWKPRPDGYVRFYEVNLSAK